MKGPSQFTDDENVFLSRAFVNCTQDSVEGAQKKDNAFWKEVHTKMHVLHDEEADVADQKKWPWESVQNRFQKTVSPAVQKFNTHCKQVVEKEQSGWTKQMYIDAAEEVWLQLEALDLSSTVLEGPLGRVIAIRVWCVFIRFVCLVIVAQFVRVQLKVTTEYYWPLYE